MGWFRRKNDSNTRQFERYGSSSYQLCIKTPEDFLSIPDLDERLWMATSCPVSGLNEDSTFLRCMDANGHGRILSDEVRGAIRWMQERLTPDPSWMTRQSRLPIRLIRSDHPTGQALLETARLVLENLKQEDAENIEIGQVRDRQKILMQADQNGDGIIPPEVVSDPETAALARFIMETCGSVKDASGLVGVDLALLDRFLVETKAYLDWYTQGELLGERKQSDIMPFGKNTASMWEAITPVVDRIDQFFTQCAFIRFEPRAADYFGLREDELKQFQYGDQEAMLTRLKEAPVYPPNEDGILTFDDQINEMYRNQMSRFHSQVVLPVLGETATLTQMQWQDISMRFDAYRQWLEAKPVTSVEKLGVERLSACLENPWADGLREYIERDKAVASELDRLNNLEKLILYHQYLFHFVNNFVSLPWLFKPGAYALFEMGTLVLDGREFATSLRVENRATNVVVAQNSQIFLLYMSVTGPTPPDNFEVVVPVTRGDPRVYYVGQRGVFFNTSGQELDAQIVQIVDNPISIRQSMLAPFRRLRAILSQRFEQLTTNIQKDTEGKITTASSTVETAVQQGVREAPAQVEIVSTEVAPPPVVQPSAPVGSSSEDTSHSSSTIRDLLIGTGFLIAGLGTAFKFLVEAMQELGNPDTLLRVFLITSVLVAVVIFLTALNAWLKLRRRDLSGVLQACGWAMNARLRLNRNMIRFFVRPALLPSDARKYRRDRLTHRLSQLRRRRHIYDVSRRQPNK